MNSDDAVVYAMTSVASNYDPTWQKIYDSAPKQEEYSIRGEMLVVSHTYDDFMINEIGKDDIKRQLAQMLAVELLKSNFIEFTQMKDNLTGRSMIKARAFVTPSDNVQILRTKGKL